jgi:nucleotide-binding universal stress UspA family protein
MTSSKIIVAYDGTSSGDDAVVLGGELAARLGAQLQLAHVYRTTPGDGDSARERDRFLRARALELIEHGARLLKDGTGWTARPVASTTTATGMRTLTEREQAALVVFGSASGTAPGRVHAGSAARRLLQVLGSAMAIAPAGYAGTPAARPLAVAVATDDELGSGERSARALAQVGGGELAEQPERASVLVVGSGQAPEHGHLRLTSRGDRAIQEARVPILVVPYGAPIELVAEQAAAA